MCMCTQVCVLIEVICFVQASTSEHSDSTSTVCKEHVLSRERKYKSKRKLSDSGIWSDEKQVKRKKHKSTLAAQEHFNDSHSGDEFHKRKHKKCKN